MKTALKLILFICLAGLRFTIAKDLTVDASLTAVSGTAYPSLAEAVSSLVNAGGFLIEPTNTITLLASTLTVTQTFPGHFVGGTGMESLLIQYESTPDTITQTSDCSLLPTVVISSNKYVDIPGLFNLTIVGLNIQYQGSVYLNRIYQSGHVMFSRFCFNNSEPDYADLTATLPSEWNKTFDIAYVYNVTITNGVYFYDGFKTLMIMVESQLTLSSMVFVPLSTMHDQFSAAIQVTGSPFTTNVNLFQTQISCFSTEVAMPAILNAGYINNVIISGFTVDNCHINGSTKNQTFLTVFGAFNVQFDDFTFNNVTFGNNSGHAMVFLAGVKNMTVSNFQINGLNISGHVNGDFLFYINDFAPEPFFYPMEVRFINLTFNNCWLYSNIMIFNFLFTYPMNYGLLQMQNISVSNLEIFWGCFFVHFVIVEPTVYSTLLDFPTIIIDNIAFNGYNSLQYGSLFFVISDPTPNLRINCEEIFHIQISNVRLENIFFSDANFLLSERILVSISDLTATNLTLIAATLLQSSHTFVSTFLLTNSQLAGITLLGHSSIAISNITEATYPLEECHNNNNVSVSVATRPFIIYNTTFTNVYAELKSILFSSTNPMVIVQNNTFSQIILIDSNLFEVGRYLYFLNYGFFIDLITGTGRLYPLQPGGERIQISETVENSIFREHPDLQLLYENTRTSIGAYEPENAVFFLSVQDNSISMIQSIQNSGLVLLNNFPLDNGTVFVKNNMFMSVASNIDVNLFAGTYIKRLLVVNNTLSGVSLPGYLLSLSASYLQTLVIDSNTLTNTQQIGNFLVTAQGCGTILLNNNAAMNNYVENPFVSISCDVIDYKVEFLNSRFENIIQSSSSGVLETLNVISITTKTKSAIGSSQVSIENNFFKNISVNGEEGFTSDIYENSFIFILALDSTLALKNNTFDQITVVPQGNVFTFSIPTIDFTDTTFSNFQFWDQNGAFKMILFNLSMTNCTFESNIGLNSEGIGLMKLTNPTPKNPGTLLKVSISNCTFENNICPSSTVLYTKNSPIQLSMSDTNFRNNYITSAGGLLDFNNITNTSIEASNCIFEATEWDQSKYQELKVFSFQYPGSNVNLTVKDSLMTLGDQIVGNFIQVTNLQQVNLNITNFTLTTAATTTTTDTLNQFSMLVADNVNAILEDIKVSNVALSQVGLFILNCDMARNLNYLWNLQIRNSSFTGVNLTQGLITINSDEYMHQALDNLTVWIQNTTFENIDWSSNTGGIVTSTTSLIGKSQGSEYAITMMNCTFKNLKGVQGLIYDGVESEFNYILWLDNSHFDSLEASGGGALINPSSTLLSEISINTPLQIDTGIITFQITNCSMRDLIAQAGAVFSWQSQTRGITLILEDNSFENIAATLHGGIVFGIFEISNPEDVLIENTEIVLTVSLKNSFYKNISAQNGAIVCFAGAIQLLDLTIEGCTFESVNSSQNGGVIGLLSTLPEN